MHFEAVLTISSVNIRREKAGGEDGDLGMDIQLKGKIGTAAFHPLLDGDQHAAALLDGIYDAEGNLRSLNVKDIAFKAEHKNLSVTLKAGPDRQKFDGVDLNSISVVPEIGRAVEVTARLQLNPGDHQVEWLADMLRKEVHIVADAKQQKLDLKDQPKAAGKGDKKKDRAASAEA